MSITEFLLARITEDQAAAADPYLDVPDLSGTFGTGYDSGGADGRSARFLTIDPARVLAECEAKRRIIELHYNGSPESDRERCSPCDTVGQPCDTLLALALVYADHPDFDETWRP